MKHRFVLPVFAAGALAITAFAQDKTGPEVLGRGPLHEAYAQPWQQNPAPNQAIGQKPPEPVPEEPPLEKPEGKNVQFIPGYWQFDTDKKDFVWISGFWREVPTGRRWVMGYWSDTAEGWRWVSGHWADEKEKDFQQVPTPPENLDRGPTTTAPDDKCFYIPGSWFYTDDGYRWRDGYWADYRIGYNWVPARYYWTPFGWGFASGYWDYGFGARGLLYAPVYFGPGFAFGAGYVYRPAYAYGFAGAGIGFAPWGFAGAGAGVGFGGAFAGAGIGFGPWGLWAGAGAGVGFGFDAVFVRTSYTHYYVGNYYAAAHLNAGITPLVTHGAKTFDPVYAHERWVNRDNPQWSTNVRNTYIAKLNGTQPAPPKTLAEQQQLGGKGLSPLQSTAQLKQAGAKMQTVSSQQLQSQIATTRQMTSQSQQWSRTASQARITTDSVPRIGAGGNFSGAPIHANAASHGNVIHNTSNPRNNVGNKPQGGFQNSGGQGFSRPSGGMPNLGGGGGSRPGGGGGGSRPSGGKGGGR